MSFKTHKYTIRTPIQTIEHFLYFTMFKHSAISGEIFLNDYISNNYIFRQKKLINYEKLWFQECSQNKSS